MIYDGYEIIDINDYTPTTYNLLGKKSKKERVYDCISVLDIETSHNHDIDNLHTWIYQWAWLLNDVIVVGREKEDIFLLMAKLLDANQDGIFRTMIHNLPYEFSYLASGWDLHFGLKGEILASAPHKPFKVRYGNMEFMCTYKMSNRSLSAWGKYYDVEHKKLDNAIDYNAIHYPTDELTETDWLYMYHDVICVKECIQALMEQEQMRYDKLMMTSTMFVKNEVTKRYKSDYKYHQAFIKNKMTPQVYQVMRKSFVGGITHANWEILGKTINIDNYPNSLGYIAHADFDSHYPTQMITKLFPIGKTTLFANYMDNMDIHDFLPNNKYAYWCVVQFENLRLKDNIKITMPYISCSKMVGDFRCIKDNGRLVASEGTSILYLSSYDIKWVLNQYTCDKYMVMYAYRNRLGKLQPYIIDTVMHFYSIKSNLKKELAEMEKDGKVDTEEYRNKKVEYNKSKNILNGLYGVCATDIVRDSITMDDTGMWHTINKHMDLDQVQKILDNHYEDKYRNKWNCYEVGTWVTSLARDELMTCIELVGYDNFLYCDTDSIFFIATDENIQAIERLNANWLLDSKLNDYCVDVKGNKKYMHKFDFEEPLKAFRTLGAKCYAMIDYNDKLNCVIAGVPERKTILKDGKEVTYSRNEELGTIENLKTGFIFSKCAPTTSVYIDDGCVILNTTHTLAQADCKANEYYTTVNENYT